MRLAIAIAAASLSLTASAALAEDCLVDATDAFDLDGDQVVALYACMEAKMVEGYTKGDDAVAAAYRSWAVTSTRPAVAGPHGNRFLQTFANDIAAAQYLKFEDDGVVMPAGSVLAKESFALGKEGKPAKVGPLFIMTKGEAGAAPDTADWIYSAVQPNGKPMTIKQSFCHDCHVGWEASDMLAYPLEEVRLTGN